MTVGLLPKREVHNEPFGSPAEVPSLLTKVGGRNSSLSQVLPVICLFYKFKNQNFAVVRGASEACDQAVVNLRRVEQTSEATMKYCKIMFLHGNN